MPSLEWNLEKNFPPLWAKWSLGIWKCWFSPFWGRIFNNFVALMRIDLQTKSFGQSDEKMLHTFSDKKCLCFVFKTTIIALCRQWTLSQTFKKEPQFTTDIHKWCSGQKVIFQEERKTENNLVFFFVASFKMFDWSEFDPQLKYVHPICIWSGINWFKSRD